VIWGFDLLKVEGEELEGISYEGGMIQKPGDFGCVFRVRGEKYSSIIEREEKFAQGVLERFEAW